MGWLIFFGIAAAAGLLLWLTRFPRKLWTVAATALMLGAAGYAWQGSPGLAGHPVAGVQAKGEIDPEVVAIRDAMFGQFNFTWASFMRADAMTRIGARDTAARAMILTVRQATDDAGAWAWLGIKLAENDGDQVSPAAKFAFERAIQLAPQHPGPPFFYGLALIREGKFAEARPYWARAAELAPAKASYRDQLLVRLFLLDRLLQAKAAQEKTGR
ncbi:cytochrome c biogenesis factor-like protein [Sphingomonas psychrotolerans]|uniref:Cytochrome c biogenesis factor-like protein n=1 Tax=Sphingomonas psychrotolerans TaxID=1327635 RepID=A0ABU3N1A7_9SPHN|nr:cytochrome c biogenesis factor-like protein [Sphingomonas psychrotolerans]MDT8758272.1 cytochrome c biogenesis factor-like protein [Sphingomonas psychrotolerans]